MNEKILSIAVISDLHCHPERDNYSDNNTLLFSDKLRSPSTNHPVENLLAIIKNEELSVNLVLSPGDFTHQSDKQGFFSGWSYVGEISRALDASDIIATVGNHDIDSRHKYSQYSFDIPQKLKQNFPLRDEYVNSFWSKGFSFVENDDYQILVLNTTHFHTHNCPIDNPVVKGKIDKAQIEEIAKYLEANNCNNKIKIVLCHHHPAKHSRSDLGEYDFIENGEELLDILGTFKYDLVIHGHKHDPWLRYYNTYQGFQLPILSAGSFSATNQISWAGKFNYFHIIELDKKEGARAMGKVTTWTFKNQIGWKKDKDDGFFPYTGFGFLENLNELVAKIIPLVKQSENGILKWQNLIKELPEIEFLTPDKINELEQLLCEEKIYVNQSIGLKPKHIYYDAD